MGCVEGPLLTGSCAVACMLACAGQPEAGHVRCSALGEAQGRGYCKVGCICGSWVVADAVLWLPHAPAAVRPLLGSAFFYAAAPT